MKKKLFATERSAYPESLPGPIVLMEGLFTAAECTAIRDYGISMPREVGLLDEGNLNRESRRSSICFLPATVEGQEMIADLNRYILTLIDTVNADFFGFKLDRMEAMQFTEYDASETGYYDWHQDSFIKGPNGRTRKLTIVVQLTDPAEYEGGSLELKVSEKLTVAPRTQGTAVFFASPLAHRAVAVTSGRRHSLVTWVHGPDFT